MRILPNISGHDDLVRLNDEERTLLCQEIREFLVSSVSKTGGHLASNLGAVELSVAIETVFNTMKDRLVFDVGHQSYVHKLLTGRQADFEHLRQFGGISGFPKPKESDSDAFVAGHASSSVSIGLGMARARTLLNQDYHVITVIGDGACTGGMAYEGLNDAAVSKEPMIIILNDNAMSIDRNVGGLAKHLSRLRSSDEYLKLKMVYRTTLKKIPGGRWFYGFSSRMKNHIKRLLLPGTIFENMGLTYLGPVDGHNLPDLIDLLRAARDLNSPVLIHVLTKKGSGYEPAERDPSKFHGIGKFDPATGETLSQKVPTFSGSFGTCLTELAKVDGRICAITAAMPSGTGLTGFQQAFPKRTFDVGIAEEHAVSMAGGLAKQGMIPVVALYSTFLQRSFDQMMQDVSMLNLHVVFAIDRAGLVGDDGETHHGIYDVGFLKQAANMTLLCPVSLPEQQAMLRWAVEESSGPVAVRYPRGGNGNYTGNNWDNGTAALTLHREGTDAVLITYGTLLDHVMEAADILEAAGIRVRVIRLMRVLPLPIEEIIAAMGGCKTVVIAEETACGSGIRHDLASGIAERIPDCRILGMDLGMGFVTHGAKNELYRACGLDAAAIAEKVKGALKA